jgi:type I restriction enzyme S subunit
MTALYEKKVGEISENFDCKRIPIKASDRAKLEKKFRYFGAQGIIDYVDDYIFDGEYILVAEDGENLRSQKSPVCNLVSGKFWVNNHAHIIRGKDGNSSRYLCYLLNEVDFYRYTSGSAQPKLTKENLKAISLRVHAPSDQQKIAKVLSTLDAKIALNNQINAELEAMAKLLYDYWFVQFDFPMTAAQAAALGKPELEGHPYKTSGGKMVFNPTLKREIPEGWEVDNILRMSDLGGGGTPSKEQPSYWNGNIPFFTPTDAEPVPFLLDTEDHITDEGNEKSSTRVYPNGTLFLTARGSVGKVMITVGEMAMSQSCYALVPHSGISSHFLYFQTQWLMDYLKVKSSGSVFRSIVTNDIKYSPTIVPPKSIIEEYADKTQSSFDQIQNNQKQNQELTELRDWLLPMLMNGQVTVG